MKLGIRYETTYSYGEEVGFSTHDVRLFPRSGRHARVRSFDFKTKPGATVRFSRDVFDNIVAACFFPERATELQLQLAINLELEEKDPFHFLLENSAVDLPFAYESSLLPILAAYRERRTSGNLEIPGWQLPTREKRQPTVATLVALNKAIHDSIGYERRVEGAAREPSETLRMRRGACRDVAVLLAEVLRRMGLAARLVSGYLRETDPASRRAEGSLHAWTEVFLPGAGWIGMDATNGVLSNHNFISAAVGLVPADITPVSGSYFHRETVPSRMTSRLELINL
jgi:transglutaminase-like putative cysteine protease